MNKRIVPFSIIMLVMVALVFSSSSAFAKKNACGKEMSPEEIAQRALDAREIQNVMTRHQLYGAYNRDIEIEMIWAHKTPGVSFASNRGVYQGDIEMIKKYYGMGETPEDKNKAFEQQNKPGYTTFRTINTPLIEVAGDGKTAKAFWYTIGWDAEIQEDKGQSTWWNEKYGVDFVKEDGEWKIWHFHVYSDWRFPMGEDLAQYTVEQEKKSGEAYVRTPSEELAPYYKDKVFGEDYSSTRKNSLTPRPPVPYCTFSDTFSYADE